ncbi:LLM class flavin-dependent oxidoreductase [Amycolatopsis bartoniae]|uniref:Luciferase n=1 Tax=Amycolatopsis bartoniae TaxID=941986 RepID=A0A8H9IT43_9PSEU|nr:LLM class flavin-dependent oxidoreductase [Amycolatopsis bartoniae]GHF34891.1 luciferase [Amycolatopsis bartoniae]
MGALSDDAGTLKFVHTYGVGLHSSETEPDVHDPGWQRLQIEEFVDFAVYAEELGFDGITVTEHHAPLMTCPSPHLLLAAAAMRTNRIRLGTAVTVLPLYSPIRVAEEAGTLDLLSGGRFELGLGRGIPGEAQIAVGRELTDEELKQAWVEGLEVVNLALTERDFTYDGKFFPVTRPTTIATRPLQDKLPVWLGGASKETMGLAGAHGWNVMRNFGSDQDHRDALEHYVKVAADHGYTRSGGNMMLERFVAIGETEDQAEENLGKLVHSFGQFLSLFTAGGRRVVPETDGEFAVDKKKNRPAMAISGTPAQIVDALQETIDATGARRVLVETFTREEARLFAREVIPVLKERNATAG